MLRTLGTLIYSVIIISLWIAAIKGKILAICDLTVIELLVIGHFSLLSPLDFFRDVQWQKPWLHRPHTITDGSIAKINFVRDFTYRSENDYDVNYITMTVDLDKVTNMDVILSYWDGMKNVAHTMLSFTFSDGQYLAFSMETRLPENVEQGMIPGLFKRYELLSVVGTEEDLFKLRTNYRGEELYLYRTNASADQCRIILHGLLQRINRQQLQPKFYNSLTHNCTTSLIPILRWIRPGFTDDIRLLLNGRSDELLFEMGYLVHRDGESFSELKKRRRVNQYLNTSSDYSRTIRTNLL